MSFKSVAEFLDPTNGYRPTTAERRLIEAVQDGSDCWLCDRKNPTIPSASTDKTRIRADLLRLLITGGTPVCGIHERGVHLNGGWIDGTLDLSYVTAKGETVLEDCFFPKIPSVRGAQLRRLSLARSEFPGLDGRNVQVDAELSLENSVSTATVDVSFASIRAAQNCKAASLSGAGNAKTPAPLHF